MTMTTKEEDLIAENRHLRGRLEAANRLIRDLEHQGLHALVVRELANNRNVDVREMDGMITIAVGRNLCVERPTLLGAVSGAWKKEWDGER